jgi:hypothetical protein
LRSKIFQLFGCEKWIEDRQRATELDDTLA